MPTALWGAFVDFCGQPFAKRLDKLHKDNEDDDHRRHDRGHETLVAIADAEIAQTFAADSADHRRIADQADDREGKAKGDRGQGLGGSAPCG